MRWGYYPALLSLLLKSNLHSSLIPLFCPRCFVKRLPQAKCICPDGQIYLSNCKVDLSKLRNVFVQSTPPPIPLFPVRRFVSSCPQKRLLKARWNEVSQFFKASFFPLEKFKLHASTNFQGNHPTPWFVLK